MTLEMCFLVTSLSFGNPFLGDLLLFNKKQKTKKHYQTTQTTLFNIMDIAYSPLGSQSTLPDMV